VRVWFSVAKVEIGIVGALVAAAREARRDRDISAEEIAVCLKVTGPGSKSKVSRFEKGEHYGEIDRVFDAYLETTGMSLMELLSAAEKKLPKGALTKRRTPSAKTVAARRAELAAKRAREASERSRNQSDGKRPSREKKSQAG
jgi:transcriptional regulator with XRE-family HTH domain